MIAPLVVILLVAQVMPATPPPAPLVQNQAPVREIPAPLVIPPIPGIDRTFAVAAFEGNAAELAMARLAEQRATIPEVKHFAEKMTSEHMGLEDDMRPALVRVLGREPSTDLAAPDQLAVAHLQTISNADFDQVYALVQVSDHLATMTVFQTEADNGTDSQLKMLARKWLPTIQAHLELAVSMARHIGGASPLR